MANTGACLTVTSEEYEAAPPPYSERSTTDQVLTVKFAHDHGGEGS